MNSEVITFNLVYGNVIINTSTYSGYNSSGAQITGQHSASQKYIITSSAQTSNIITLGENNLICDITLSNVNRPESGKGLIIGGDAAQYSNQNIILRLEGENTLGQLFYVGNNKLKITSVNGDSSTNGTLIVKASDTWSAAIGGDDSPESFSGLTIAGGTINATATNGAAIGGGGNGNAEITITGGKITANNSGTSATIGGGGGDSGYGGDGTITITGGTVYAKNSNDNGMAIGGGGSKQSTSVGDAVIRLLGGNITAVKNGRAYAGGYSQKDQSWGDTYVEIGPDVIYTGRIYENATIVYTQPVFDLSKANVVFNGETNTYTGMNSTGVVISGPHKETTRYIVRQSSGATSNVISLNGKISGTVHIELDGINSTNVNSIDIPAEKDNEKHVVLYLKGENYVNNIRYYTDTGDTSNKEAQSDSTLKITSVSGDGSTDGSLYIHPTSGSVFYDAAIGGTDGEAGVAGLIIAGGTLDVRVGADNDCSAIGGGGNGYAEITITGGNIYAENASTGATIGGGVGYNAQGPGCDILITGGEITAKNNGKYKDDGILSIKAWCYGVAIGGGSSYKMEANENKSNITIKGGTVTAIVPEGQTAIGAGNSNLSNAGAAVVTIEGGIVNCEGGIGGGSTVDGNGGSGMLNVIGGNLTVRGFIGGGVTKNGEKGGEAKVDISGRNTVVKAASIGGGIAEASGIVSKANVTIEAGQVQAQVVMEGVGSTFDMSGGTIDNSQAAAEGFTFKVDDGGAVYVGNGEAKMTGGTIQNCSTDGKGGAIFITGGNFTMSGGTIQNCSAQNGGAAYVSTGNFAMTSGTLNGNRATDDGGAVYVTDGAVVIGDVNCAGETHVHPVLTNNSAVNGGAIAVAGSTPQMYCGIMSSNTTTANGGAVYVFNGGFDMENGTITGNNAVDGGAVYLTNGTFEMSGGSLSNNSTNNNGGAAYIENGDILIFSGNVTSNACTYNGGAFYVADGNVSIGVESCLYEPDNNYHTVSGYTEMTHPLIQYNNANRGGSIYLSSANGLVQHYCGTMIDNYAYDTGRNIYLENGTFNYYAGQIGTNFDTGIEIENGVFEDLSEEAQEKIVKELIYHSSLVPYTEDDEVKVNAGIPETKWINAPNAVNLLLEDVDPDSPTWGELFPEYTFVNWYSEENEKSIDLYADWVGSSMNLFKIQQGEQGQSGVLLPSGGLML